MKQFLLLLLIFGLGLSQSYGQTLAERLGYSKETKLLIIHADDLGMSHAENEASILAMKIGMVNSASIMVPCPWFPEIAAYAKDHPEADLGLHLTVTSEWKHLKWGSAAKPSTVPSLLNEQGFFHDNCQEFAENAKLEEVELELRAQVDRAIAFGVVPTHLDSHMGCVFFSSPEIFEVYLKVGRAYGVPTLVEEELLNALPQAFRDKMKPTDIVINKGIIASPEHYPAGMAAYYENEMRNLPAGISTILLHAAFNNEEMQAVTVDHPDYGAHWRQIDFDFFTSDKCKEILEEEQIKLVTWREIQAIMQ